MMMVEGTLETVVALRGASGVYARIDEAGQIVEEIARPGVAEIGREGKVMMPGIGVKRRYWFESMGVPIGNLIVL
jgi:hypothetical protein